jgi:hypothetical protein
VVGRSSGYWARAPLLLPVTGLPRRSFLSAGAVVPGLIRARERMSLDSHLITTNSGQLRSRVQFASTATRNGLDQRP